MRRSCGGNTNGVFGFLSSNGTFRPLLAKTATPKASATLITGKLLVNFTFTIAAASNVPPTAPILCGLQMSVAGTDQTGVSDFVAETDQATATRSGSTATCQVVIPYTWNLYVPASDTVTISGSATAVDANGKWPGEPLSDGSICRAAYRPNDHRSMVWWTLEAALAGQHLICELYARKIFMRYIGVFGGVLAAAMTFSLTALGQTARAPENKHVVISMRERNTILPRSANRFDIMTFGIERYVSPPTLLEGLAEINPITCTEIAVGAWTPSPSQACGTVQCGVVTTGTVKVTQASGVCAGHTFTFATIYYEWMAHNNQSTLPAPPNSVEDTFNATWAVPDGSVHTTFLINEPVVRPDHETTSFLFFKNAYGYWQQTLVPPSSDPTFDFSNETVREFAAGQAGPDMCWYFELRKAPIRWDHRGTQRPLDRKIR
jgi:hypothetical protein